MSVSTQGLSSPNRMSVSIHIFDGIRLHVCNNVCAHVFDGADPQEMLTWHQPHCSTPWLQCPQKALPLSHWEGEGGRGQKEMGEAKEREVVSLHKQTAVTCMDKMSPCVRV